MLSVPKLRAEYDRTLSLEGKSQGKLVQEDFSRSLSGLDTYDLDALGYDAVTNEWFKNCRCGDERGFLIRVSDLEEASDLGELLVGCRGCSLWIKVLFSEEEEDTMD